MARLHARFPWLFTVALLVALALAASAGDKWNH